MRIACADKAAEREEVMMQLTEMIQDAVEKRGSHTREECGRDCWRQIEDHRGKAHAECMWVQQSDEKEYGKGRKKALVVCGYRTTRDRHGEREFGEGRSRLRMNKRAVH